MSDMTPEQEARLQELSEALRQEFADTTDKTPTRKSALTDLEELKGDFLSALQHVLRHGSTEALKARVAMWGFDKLLEQDKASKKDVLEELLGGMPIPQRDGAEEKK